MKKRICRDCGTIAKPSTGIVNIHNIRVSGKGEFETKQVNCLKCPSCGHSWTEDK
jgi:hypothetical protein